MPWFLRCTRVGFPALVFALCAALLRPVAATAAGEPPPGEERLLPLTAQVTTTAKTFKQYLYSFPLDAPAALSGLSGSVSILSQGRGFAEALVSVGHVPADEECPANGEVYDTYPEIRARHPGLQTLAKFIVKEPLGSTASSVPTELVLPRPIPVKRCLVVILDGAVLRVGGPFTMSSHIVARLLPDPATVPAARTAAAAAPARPNNYPVASLAFDDEFCFDRESGCDLATTRRSAEWSFRKVTKLHHPGALLAIYGNVGDSAFGWEGARSSRAAWTIENAYYLYPQCGLAEGPSGPEDYFAQVPPDATRLLSFELKGAGQAALHRPVYQAFTGLNFVAGDCLVHLIRLDAAAPLGGVDSESQIRALVEYHGS